MYLKPLADDDRLAIVLGIAVLEQERDAVATVAACDALQFKVTGSALQYPHESSPASPRARSIPRHFKLVVTRPPDEKVVAGAAQKDVRTVVPKQRSLPLSAAESLQPAQEVAFGARPAVAVWTGEVGDHSARPALILERVDSRPTVKGITLSADGPDRFGRRGEFRVPQILQRHPTQPPIFKRVVSVFSRQPVMTLHCIQHICGGGLPPSTLTATEDDTVSSRSPANTNASR
jgi:hypothetical protein